MEVTEQSEWTKGRLSMTVLTCPAMERGHLQVKVKLADGAIWAMRCRTILRDWTLREQR